MKGLATILRNTKIPQGAGALATYKDGKLIDKCAMGVISCEVGMKVAEITKDQTPLYDYYKILEKAGISQEEQVRLPLLFQGVGDDLHFIENVEDSDIDQLSAWIYKLNDKDFTFAEIADFLETTFPEEDWAK